MLAVALLGLAAAFALERYDWGMWLLPAALTAAAALAWFLWRDWARPVAELRAWLPALRAGELSARMECAGAFEELCGDLNFVAEMLESQTRKAAEQVHKHTGHMVEKTRSLTALYRIAAELSASHDFDNLMRNMLKTLGDVMGFDAVVVRRRAADGALRRVASVGALDAADRADSLPADSPALATSAAAGRLALPIVHKGDALGVCSFYLDPDTFARRDELDDFFASIGRYLGLAFDHDRRDADRRRLSIMEERARLANELHDSLAQTVSSMRFGMRVLEQVLHTGDAARIRAQLETMEHSVEEANREVRELIKQFRAPPEDAVLLESAHALVERFRAENPGIRVFFDDAWGDAELPSDWTYQILRILQEALTNIKKHGRADLARIMLRRDNSGYHVLIEDNGVGMRETCARGTADHMGLDIMRERAASIGGHLTIESEPGDGVRVALHLASPPAAASRPVDRPADSMTGKD